LYPVMIETAHPKRGGRAYHSILEPHLDFIREQRQRRRTWQEIAGLLHSEKGIRVTLYAPYLFYRRKLKRTAKPHWEDGHKPEVIPSAHPNDPASRPESGRKPVLAATPTARVFRKPSPDSIELNDPTKP
jgi:hypothetical protein